jgi:hypothetical protein
MREYSTDGTTITMFDIERRAEKELRPGQRCRINGKLYERVHIRSGNGWRDNPLMIVKEAPSDEKG